MITRRIFTNSALTLAALSCSTSAFGQSLGATQDLRVALGFDDMASVDPHTSVTSINVPIVRTVYEALLAYPPGFLGASEVIPALAENWESSADKKTWIFHLRRGVQWHAGFGEFTSADAKFSIERVAGTTFASPFRQTLENVEAVHADDPYTLRVVLRDVDPLFALRMVNFQAGFIVCKKAIESGVDIRTQPIGTGPFQFDSYKAREKLVLKRNDAYWGGKPTLTSITWYFMPDDASRELALRTGEVHAIDLQARQDIVNRVRAQRLVVDIPKSGTPYWLFFNVRKKPFDDIRVRRALAHATDRDELVSFLGKDIADAEYSAIPDGYLGHIDQIEKYPFDIAKAKALLAEAGHPDGFAVNIAMSNAPTYLPYMQVIQAQWKKVGVALSFRVVDHPTYHRLIREDLNAIVMYQATRYPKTAQIYLEQFYAKDAAVGKKTTITNFSNYGDAMPGVDDLIEKARASTDSAVQLKLWEEAQQRIARDAVALPLFNQNAVIARSPLLDLQTQPGNMSFYMFSTKARILAG
ncbi:ABC transporter substrate-binding protein [Limobrevibacterium gyesilva]|uniref:ABC transporter substrate-binding protein n=1 Tax=Limobrevibacterium gyesilva TaxID=2991712 RepID=A0AA41YN02_9PROT|nr:ABC transporter substrate-binding protein [Limobrevibacterium gyesilva]MCW3475511.1 ABC transporter substrate-binding protein [Limobrevibacterium gyesilva]